MKLNFSLFEEISHKKVQFFLFRSFERSELQAHPKFYIFSHDYPQRHNEYDQKTPRRGTKIIQISLSFLIVFNKLNVYNLLRDWPQTVHLP